MSGRSIDIKSCWAWQPAYPTQQMLYNFPGRSAQVAVWWQSVDVQPNPSLVQAANEHITSNPIPWKVTFVFLLFSLLLPQRCFHVLYRCRLPLRDTAFSCPWHELSVYSVSGTRNTKVTMTLSLPLRNLGQRENSQYDSTVKKTDVMRWLH